jgi:hypothetical protein
MKTLITILAVIFFSSMANAQQRDDLSIALSRLKTSLEHASAEWSAQHTEESATDIIRGDRSLQNFTEIDAQVVNIDGRGDDDLNANAQKPTDPDVELIRFAIAINDRLEQIIRWADGEHKKLQGGINIVDKRVDKLPNSQTFVHEYLPAPTPYIPPAHVKTVEEQAREDAKMGGRHD